MYVPTVYLSIDIITLTGIGNVSLYRNKHKQKFVILQVTGII